MNSSNSVTSADPTPRRPVEIPRPEAIKAELEELEARKKLLRKMLKLAKEVYGDGDSTE